MPPRVLSAILFSPRGGSAHAARALARGLREQGCDGDAGRRLARRSRRPWRRASVLRRRARGRASTPRWPATRRMRFAGPPGSAPMHPSFEDRPGAPDRVFATLDDAEYERQVAAWSRELDARRSARGRRAAPAPSHPAQRGRRPRRSARPGRRPAARHRAADARADRRGRRRRTGPTPSGGRSGCAGGRGAARVWSSPRPGVERAVTLLERAARADRGVAQRRRR